MKKYQLNTNYNSFLESIVIQNKIYNMGVIYKCRHYYNTIVVNNMYLTKYFIKTNNEVQWTLCVVLK